MGSMPVTLTIAGSDSGGGAGIQADLKTFQALGCYGTSAITAITCQNTKGVKAVQGIDPEIVAGQILAVLDDFPVRAVKTGMLYSAAIIRAVREALRTIVDDIPLVIDPVMVATSGHLLLQEEGVKEMIDFLQLARIITPNLPEAEVILGRSIHNEEGVIQAASDLNKITGSAVLLKGGHFSNNGSRGSSGSKYISDYLYDGNGISIIQRPLLETKNTHGTGCTLSAAIVSCLAKDMSLNDSVGKARDYLQGALEHATSLGSGNGPLNHSWELFR